MREAIPSGNLLKDIPPFAGFPKERRRYFQSLGANNDRRWFEEHREEYERLILAPMRAFVVEAGQKLRKKVPKLIADPRVGGSIMRIARDTRFSADKSPYKTWIAAHFRDGKHKDSGPGFYIHVDADSAYAGGGIYQFEDDQLDRYRKAVSDPKSVKALRAALKKVDGFEIGGEALKRVPRGFEPDHPSADLLRHKGLYAGCDLDNKRVPTAGVVEDAVRVYERLLPLHQWLIDHVVVGGPTG